MKHAVVLQHVAFEDLGTLKPLLLAQGWQLHVLQAGVDVLDGAETADLLVVLGGPISANDTGTYPFVNDSIALLQRRLQRQRPTLGICLGAQLMARALGASVAPSGGKEIGFAPLLLTDEGQQHSVLRCSPCRAFRYCIGMVKRSNFRPVHAAWPARRPAVTRHSPSAATHWPCNAIRNWTPASSSVG